MKHIILAGAALLLNSITYSNATAGFERVSGADLKKICTSYVDVPSNTSDGICVGYVVGVMSVMEYINALCLPARSSHAQATLVVQKYLSDHPEKLHLDAEVLVIDAIQEAFPCPDARGE